MERPDAEFLVVGWGGRSFYVETPTWADLKPGPLLRSFTLDASVLHVELSGAIVPDAPGVRAIDLGAGAFEALLVAIEATLARDESGRPVVISGAGYGAFDRFFEAQGSFNALVGCNVLDGAGAARGGRSDRSVGRRCRRRCSGRSTCTAERRALRPGGRQSALASSASMSSSDRPKWWPISWMRTWATSEPRLSSCSAQ